MKNNRNIFEINTRVWLRKFNDENPTLKNVPKNYWQNLADKGMDYIWLMGIWKTNESVIDNYCFTNDLMIEYRRALKDFNDKDVIGSPYSIDSYVINPQIGTEEELLELKDYLNSLGMKLILDFVPNHFSVHSSLIKKSPELFLTVSEDFYKRDPHTYFKSIFHNDKYFAHGRDPFFPAWEDTVQVNYFNPDTRSFMTDTLKNLTALCDGVRCDMAMLALNNVFDNTWSGAIANSEFKKPEVEFWQDCIKEVKNVKEDFIFIGEAYWDLEWELQRLGFDFTYDKKLLDRLRIGNVNEIRAHLMAEKDFQQKSVRFIENHDEERSLISLGTEKAKAAAIIISTIYGMKLYYDGQFEGKRIKLPVQLGREPDEKPNQCIIDLYEKLFEITSSEVFKNGNWELLSPTPSWKNNQTYKNLLAWQIEYMGKKRLVVINYSKLVSQARIELNVSDYPYKFKLKDLLNDKTYYRKTEEVASEGLFVELGPFKSHIFSY